MADAAYLTGLSKRLTDEGHLIEAGWESLRRVAISPTATKEQLTEARKIFFAGAQHLFSSILAIMDEDHEPSPDDVRRMSQIHDELIKFAKDLELEFAPAEGHS